MLDHVQFSFPPAQAPLWVVAGVLVLALGVLALRFAEKRRERRLRMMVEAELADRLMPGYDRKFRSPLAWFTLAALVFALLTLAQPRWGRSWVNVSRTGRDIMVLLDTSESMNAQNPLPTRLERARQKVQSLLDLCPGDRFGLIAFSGEATLQSPLTLDHNYFRAVLDAVSTDTITTEGTDITSALREAKKVFEEDVRKSGESRKHARIILVITDGEETAGEAMGLAEKMRDHAGIYVLGVGDPKGATVTFPAWMQRYTSIPEEKRTRLSRLDEEKLAALAKGNGGAYVRITPDNSDVNFLHDEWEQIQAKALSGEMRYNLVNRYRWPLSAMVFFIFAEGVWLAVMPRLRAVRMNRMRGTGNG